jgi:hypothetical protein
MIDKTTGFLCVDKPVIPASAAPPPRRRARLYSSCAVNALLVMPAALSVGIILADPAEAQVTITSNSGVSLSEYGPGPRNFINIEGHRIGGDPTAVYGDQIYVWTLTNAGTIVDQASIGGTGILFDSDGTVINTGSIVDDFDGSVQPGAYGIKITGSASVNNSGLIDGSTAIALDADGTIGNLGTIAGVTYGVDISGTHAYLNNQASGDVAGYISAGVIGVLMSGANASVANAGTILAENTNDVNATGIYLSNGGEVTNQAGASILAYTTGVEITGQAGTVMNSGTIDSWGNGTNGIGVLLGSGYVSNASTGTIFGGSLGVDFTGGGTIDNAGGISGTTYGVFVKGTAGTLTNTGTITGGKTGAVITRNGNVDNSGLIEGTNEGLYIYGQSFMNITNQSAGTITGARGLETHYTATLDNAGVISGTSGLGMYLAGGGMLTNESTGTISGTDTAIRASFAPQAVLNAGLISSTGADGIDFLAGGSLTNSLSGTITAGLVGVYDHQGTLLFQNDGMIYGGSIGVAFTSLGTISNDGSIGGGTYGVSLGSGSLDNQGTIDGAGEGVVLSQGGTVLNAGSVNGLEIGIALRGSLASVDNQVAGTIQSDNIALYGASDTFSLTNTGTIETESFEAVRVIDGAEASASNASTGTIIGGGYGIGLNDGSDTLINSGLIEANDAVFLAGAYALVTNNATGTLTGGFGIEGFVGTLNLQNSGLIDASTGTDGIIIAGTLVSIDNQAGGMIMGHAIGVAIEAAAATLMNEGLVTGGNFGVSLSAGGTIANSASGTISSSGIGIFGQATTIQNTGLVTGTSDAGVIMNGGQLSNLGGGTINGGDVGLVLDNGATASNAGLISDSALPTHYGAVLNVGAALTNLAGGTITGGTGVLINGDNSTLVNAGTITGKDGTAIAVGANLDPAQITLTTGSTEIGTIDGGGTDGEISLTGDNTLTNTIADFGAGSGLDIAAGADWTATGNWTVANVTNNGTFQPGVIGKALTLDGNFTQSATGVLQVVVTPKVTSRLIVDGAVKLAGELTYAFAPGTYEAGEETFLTATQGVTGGFSTINYLGDVPASLQHATGAVATAAALKLSGMDVGPTPPPTPPHPPSPPMLVTPADDVLYADAPQAAAMAAQDASADLLNHATIGDAGNAACAAASGVARANAGATGASMAARMTTAVAAAFCNAGGWVAATGTAMTLDGAGDAAGYHTESGGVLAGMDAPVRGTEARLGIAVGYDKADLKDSAGGKVDIGTTRIGLYGTQPVGRFTLAGDFMVGLADDTASRSTGIGTARTKFGGTDYAGGVQISAAGVVRGLTFAPIAGLRIASASDAAFAESGAGVVRDFAVSGDKAGATSIQPYATLDVSRWFLTPGLISITPSVSVGYVVEAGSLGKSVTVTAADGTDFTARAATPDASAAQLGAGIAAAKGNWSVYARYTAYVAGNWSSQSGEAGLQLRF